tara:strand:+ start:964 stop:1248 length:285 start_codon:yes stop_codon:yes gene_type:complete
MKMTKQQLKQIIKEELGGVLTEMGPEFPGEELPQGPELDSALNPPMDTDAAPTAEDDMTEWFNNYIKANGKPPEATEIERMWSDISHDYRSRGM